MKFAKKKAKIKIKFQKMKGTFLDSNPWIEKSPIATAIYIYLNSHKFKRPVSVRIQT